MTSTFGPLPTSGVLLDRRTFVTGVAASALPLLTRLAPADTNPPAAAFPGMIVREREPVNLEFPFSTLDSFLTPNERFFVRNHFAIPEVDLPTWRLTVAGAVRQPLHLSLDELRQLPSRTVTATLECAGNSRAFLVPRPRGVTWEFGAVSNAEWTGVPLAAVLERAGVRDGAVDVILEGADSGVVNDEPKSPGPIHFARSISLEKARRPEVLLAYRMNGKELPVAHGFPLRAIVPGWYGVASVKWLTRILVSTLPFRGYYQTLDYSIFRRRDGLPTLQPISELEVKAQIARPAPFEVVPAGMAYRVFGAAWTGESEVSRVEVSTDGGKSWAPARLLESAVAHAWRFWEYSWQAPATPGRQVLLARATDKRGRTQPLQRDPDRRNYVISHVLPTEVEVR
jgi:DMSO/TMAO reductase YedYZ molybdopterin-dependent catalytic subunit